jgi:hypothetical protein
VERVDSATARLSGFQKRPLPLPLPAAEPRFSLDNADSRLASPPTAWEPEVVCGSLCTETQEASPAPVSFFVSDTDSRALRSITTSPPLPATQLPLLGIKRKNSETRRNKSSHHHHDPASACPQSNPCTNTSRCLVAHGCQECCRPERNCNHNRKPNDTNKRLQQNP